MNTILLLNDLLQLKPEEIAHTKVRLNTYNGYSNPLDEYKENPQKLLEWNYWNNKPYHIGQLSVGLVNMRSDRWLLFTVGEITGVKNVPPEYTGVAVEYRTLSCYNCLYGRVIVRFHNKARQMFRNAAAIFPELEVLEILPSMFKGFEFPGYDHVRLSFTELKTIIFGDYPQYKNALENQKAVYLITDTCTGKLYVGSATAKEGMLLSRWKSYICNGHGGDVSLKQLIDKKGLAYAVQHFQFSILENYNSRVDDGIILQREQYWKAVLCTTKHGYNNN